LQPNSTSGAHYKWGDYPSFARSRTLAHSWSGRTSKSLPICAKDRPAARPAYIIRATSPKARR